MSSVKALCLSIVIILLFALVEVVGGYFSNSLTLFSDAGHMSADSLSLIAAAVAAWAANKPATCKNTFGLARIEVITACASSIFLIVVVAGIAIEAFNRFQHPQTVAGLPVMVIAFIGFVAHLAVAWILHKGEENINTKAALLHVITDLLGSLATIVCGIIIYFTGWMAIDPILSLVLCALILTISVRLFYKTLVILMESAPSGMNVAEISTAMAKVQHVQSVNDLHVWMLSSNKLVLSAHVELNNIHHWHEAFNDLQLLLKNRFGIAEITIQPEIKQFKKAHVVTRRTEVLH